MLLIKSFPKRVSVLMSALAAQRANAVIGILKFQISRAEQSQNDLIRQCEASIRHLEWLADQSDDAFMAATCRSLIDAFEEIAVTHNLNVLCRQYRLPARYFIQRFGTRELFREFLQKAERRV